MTHNTIILTHYITRSDLSKPLFCVRGKKHFQIMFPVCALPPPFRYGILPPQLHQSTKKSPYGDIHTEIYLSYAFSRMAAPWA